MNLAHLSLVVCPAIVAFASIAMQSVQAVELTDTAQPQANSEPLSSPAWAGSISNGLVSDPQVPRGCLCSRCLQSTERLQGQFPKF
uniref:Secreted protein n=1 Tax=Oscillatoriales cyanobacterium SpSt-402 TaxID=2282168 RepID=A0A832H1G2_9CYAN